VLVEGYLRDIGTADAYRQAREEWPARAHDDYHPDTAAPWPAGEGPTSPITTASTVAESSSAHSTKYVYVIVKQRFDDDIYVNYSRKEIVSRVADLEHELVREAMQKTGVASGVEITRCTNLSLRVIAKLQFVVKATLDCEKVASRCIKTGLSRVF
jgi:hypothetical protein